MLDGPTMISTFPAGTRAAAPAFTVVVRTLGADGRLADALASLDRQEWRDFEIVVVDMSGGEIASILDRFAARLPNLRRLVLPRSSRPVALNAGVAAARGGWIAILDDDNVYDAGHLAILAAGLSDPLVDYVYTGVRHTTYSWQGEFVTSCDVSIPFERESLRFGNYIYATGSAYRKALWERLGGYDRRFPVFEDWDFLLRVASFGKIRHLPVVSSESRKFTGLPGVANFEREIAAVRRCHAGVHWKHRHLLDAAAREQLKQRYSASCAVRQPPRQGLLTRLVCGWRLELGWDLLSWWWGLLPWVAGRTSR